MVHRNSRYGGTVKYGKTVGTEEQMKSRYGGTVGTEEQYVQKNYLQRNSKYRGTVGTEE